MGNQSIDLLSKWKCALDQVEQECCTPLPDDIRSCLVQYFEADKYKPSGLKGREIQRHWGSIARNARELVKAIDGERGRSLAATYTLHANAGYDAVGWLSGTPEKMLGAELAEAPLWWAELSALLRSIERTAERSAAYQERRSSEAGPGAPSLSEIDDNLERMFAYAENDHRRNSGVAGPSNYQKFRRAIAPHLPSRIRAQQREAFAQRSKRRKKREQRLPLR